MNAEILTVQNLTGGYPTFQIKNISFSLQKGDFVGVIGPNGSGKSTLMRLILSDLRPVVGKIVLAGKELKAMHSREKAQQIAVVTQQVEHCSMSVLDYVLLGRMP
jgi:iron complex transport system ATP-binding protein